TQCISIDRCNHWNRETFDSSENCMPNFTKHSGLFFIHVAHLSHISPSNKSFFTSTGDDQATGVFKVYLVQKQVKSNKYGTVQRIERFRTIDGKDTNLSVQVVLNISHVLKPPVSRLQ